MKFHAMLCVWGLLIGGILAVDVPLMMLMLPQLDMSEERLILCSGFGAGVTVVSMIGLMRAVKRSGRHD